MIKDVEIRVLPQLVNDSRLHLLQICKELNIKASEVTNYTLVRRSIDARKSPAVYVLRFKVHLGTNQEQIASFNLNLKNVSTSETALVIGFGPAGMFAALKLIELGIKPIVIERGKEVRDRRHDIAAICKHGIVNPESNYCFGEGGAGTFSDGKLYTRSNKRGSIERILNIFVSHGASQDILIDAHPHIGTNKLPTVVQSIRNTIIEYGGEVHFNKKVTNLIKDSSAIKGVKLASGETLFARAIILATGHSARDIFQTLKQSNISLDPKPFAVGVRVEHPQELIDKIQYRNVVRGEDLPPATYSLVAQCNNRGVFSFCMCPGGIICPAATKNDEIVVNGWSPSKRNSYFANSGIVSEIKEDDLLPFKKNAELAGVSFQQTLEEKAFILGGGKQVAPAQRLTDFITGKVSPKLPRCSYLPGIKSVNLAELFPQQLLERLRLGFQSFSTNKKGYISEEAVVLAVESRTSSPVRIPRDNESLMHPEVLGLFPSGEGGGYAGGIVSAAMDGENVAQAVCKYYR